VTDDVMAESDIDANDDDNDDDDDGADVGELVMGFLLRPVLGNCMVYAVSSIGPTKNKRVHVGGGVVQGFP